MIRSHSPRLPSALHALPTALLAVGLLGACGPKATPAVGASASDEGVRLVVEPQAPRLCVSAMPSTGRLRGPDREAWEAGVAHLRAGRLEEAGVAFAHDGRHPALKAGQAVVHTFHDRNAEARRLYEELLRLAPADGCLLQAAALNDLFEGSFERGQLRANVAWQRSPDDLDAGLLYAFLLAQTDPPGAQDVLRTLIEEHPDSPTPAYNLGMLHLALGQPEPSVPHLEVAVAGGLDAHAELLVAYYYSDHLPGYLALASSLGLPLGDEGRIAEADDPVAAYYDLLQVPPLTRPLAIIETSMGELRCELLAAEAPVTVGNFVGLARGTLPWLDPETGEERTDPLYSGTIFHRVIPDFVIQGGDPAGSGVGGPGWQFLDEIHAALTFDRPGLLAMANAGPDTNGSQFFITDAPVHHLDGRHTIFGVCDAEAVKRVHAIARVDRGERERPREDVVIHQIRIEAPGAEPLADEPADTQPDD